MERKSRLAVFEHVNQKEQTKNTGTKVKKRLKSPETNFEEVQASNTKKRKIGVQANVETTNLFCKYENCNFLCDKYSEFLIHLEVHVEEVIDIEDELQCMWENCSFKPLDLNVFKQHVNFHGYFARLASVGSGLVENMSLPVCSHTPVLELPTQPSSYSCHWTDCGTTFLQYQTFLNHIECHINCREDNYRCKWQGCKNKYGSVNKLREHMRTHSKEKVVGCPSCGASFASRTKFIDHRKRQLSSELQGYQCSQCSKLFASERLLRDHMRVHINHYKCHLCDMTCSKPSMLAKHIRYRHLPDRHFTCKVCAHRTVSRQDLATHLRTHDVRAVLKCDRRGCDFSCRMQGYQCSQCSKLFASERLLRDHMRVHINHYKCHLCDMTCSKPSMLAKHIRYRHLPDRPFTCKVCAHRTVSRQDLATHLRTHDVRAVLKCDRRGCDFSCRSKWALSRHCATRHDRNWAARYACHCCPAMFIRGAILTKHLIRVHDFHWPSGHSRFLYKQDTRTGLFHLQLVRYESLEVTQEMMGNEAASVRTPALTSDVHYECTSSPADPFTYELKIAQPKTSEIKTQSFKNELETNAPISRPTRPRNNDGDSFKYEFVDVDNPAYESDDTDNLVICG